MFTKQEVENFLEERKRFNKECNRISHFIGKYKHPFKNLDSETESRIRDYDRRDNEWSINEENNTVYTEITYYYGDDCYSHYPSFPIEALYASEKELDKIARKVIRKIVKEGYYSNDD